VQLRSKPISLLSQQFLRILRSYSSQCYNTSSSINSLRGLMVVYFLLQRNLFYTEINVVTTRVLVLDYPFVRKHRHYITGWGISRYTPLYPTNGLSYALGSQYIVVGGKAAGNVWHGCHGRHFEGRHIGSNFGILNGKGACDMSFNTSLISEEQWWSPFPPTLSCWEVIVSEMWKIRKKSTITGCFPVLFQLMKDVSNNPRTHRDRGEEWWTIGQGDCGGV
jgi:hypothetical protein